MSEADNCSCYDAAMERQALMNGSVFKPVFPENLPYWMGDNMDGGGWHMGKREARKIMESINAAEGVKHDSGKPRYELIPPEALEGTVRVLTFGARKYGDRNFERGILYSRVFGAAMRHLWTWWRGEDNDPETGESHLHHAACCVMMLQTYTERSMKGFDDRPKK